ncbi:hypothetical protein FOZ76_01580 [Verticiella sediminum]|uniref:Acetoacetate decarboxylase n=1 Tax=Verticiella sediminum TaxID=1247510 RepID=A0A556B0Z1_9BURK|nr:acetoacetate decarboxylase family protein [Verticiella sediminum]TSH98832.1 hypothetical protein FOZ76_01580 [Verticiella sediminum]
MAQPPLHRMPTAFGPTPGPRRTPGPEVRYDDARSPLRTSAYAIFQTDAHALADLRLPAGVTLRGPALLALEYTFLEEIDWLAGRGYNMLSVRVPVRCTPAAAAPIDGWFQPVIWENLADPIISGREELGWNKIYAELPPARIQGPRWELCASWQGYRFLDIALDGLADSETPLPATGPVLHHKYVPATQAWGEADVDYLTMTPAGGSPARLLSHRVAASASAAFARPRWEDMPTQSHIVNGLAALPLGELHSAGVYVTRGGKDLSDQKRLLPAA